MNRKPGKPRAVICLAAGKSQLVVIRKAKELGFSVIAVDRNPAAPGFQLADERIIASTYESVPILSELDRFINEYDIAGVVNRSSGPPVVTAAELSERMGLPGAAPNIARRAIDKEQLKLSLQDSGVRVPAGQCVSDNSELSGKHVEFPCVVRPTLSLVGKSGVWLVAERETLPQAIGQACKVSLNGRVMVEEFIRGYNLSLYGFVQNGELRPLVLIDELNGISPEGAVKGVGMVVPSRFQHSEESLKIEDAAIHAVARLGIGTSVCYLSFRCPTGGEPTLIEMHLDMGADLILEELLPASTDFDFFAYFIRALTGERQRPAKISPQPVALLYGDKKEPECERSFRLLRAESRTELERQILREEANIHA